MFSFRSDDIEYWFTRIPFYSLADFNEILDEKMTILDEGEDMPYSDILTGSFQDFESLYNQYVTDATTEVYFSSVELGIEYEIMMTQPKNIAREANSRAHSQKNRFDKSKMLPKKRPLRDVITSENDIKIIVELPGVNKEDIKVRVLDDRIVNIVVRKGDIKYNRKVRIPAAADTDSGRSKFNNGILEIRFDKKKKVQPANQIRKVKNT
jgi:HSP20 family protein